MGKRKKNRLSKKQREIFQTLIFFGITILSIVGLITYLWVYTEIDGTLVAIEIQNSTVNQLTNDIKELTNDIETLSRIDNISIRARDELGMISAQAESIFVYTNPHRKRSDD